MACGTKPLLPTILGSSEPSTEWGGGKTKNTKQNTNN